MHSGTHHTTANVVFSTASRPQLEQLGIGNVASHSVRQSLDLRSLGNSLASTMYRTIGAQEHAPLPQPPALYLSAENRAQQGPYFTQQAQTQGQYSMPRPYGMWDSPNSQRDPDPRFVQNGVPAAIQCQFPPYVQRGPELAAVPSCPRGPPWKPKRSGYALWVGNLPPTATVGDLKDHFARDARADIESIFLISKSNCAFVNYRSEEASADAMTRFHNSLFYGVRLVCRLRRDFAASSGSGPAATADGSPRPACSDNSRRGADCSLPGVDQEPLIVHSDGTCTSSLSLKNAADLTRVSSGQEQWPMQISPAAAGNERIAKWVPDKFFIMKSLTAQDLVSSVRDGTWATQNHNESTLNQAFQDAHNVYLIFSANKSGEYFGYAR